MIIASFINYKNWGFSAVDFPFVIYSHFSLSRTAGNPSGLEPCLHAGVCGLTDSCGSLGISRNLK